MNCILKQIKAKLNSSQVPNVSGAKILIETVFVAIYCCTSIHYILICQIKPGFLNSILNLKEFR